MSRHEWVGKVIHWELCSKYKFDHTNEWYMHNPAPVQENDTHKLLWDADIQTDYLISAKRPDLIIINIKKEDLTNCRLSCPSWALNKTEDYEKKDKYLDIARELKKKKYGTEGDNYTNCNWCFWYWKTWKLADEWRPSKLQHYWERPEYWEESWRLEETGCHSNSREKPSAKTDVKNSHE